MVRSLIKAKFSKVFFELSEILNVRTHMIEIFESFVKVEGLKVYKKGNWSFQQDSISAHKAKITQTWSETNFSKFMLSSNF